MKFFLKPKKSEWRSLVERPVDKSLVDNRFIESIFNEISERGDDALRNFTKQFDGVELESFEVSANEFDTAISSISDDLKASIQLALKTITKFHSAQFTSEEKITTIKGVDCWRISRGIEKVGIYIPGGTAPLFSTVLMLGIPAKLAGCKEIILCTPPDKNGTIHPAILYTAQLIGIDLCYKIGGAQAIAALTLGTESIPKVQKIFGPGNQYVTAAKQFAMSFGVAIDMPAGPSELLVIADATAIPSFVAADLLSQAEHGADSQVVVVTNSQIIVEKVLEELELQLPDLPREEIARKALMNSRAIVFETIEECIDFSNYYAPEHLILAINEAETQVEKIINAGSVFLGNFSCESAGDYASGTNHTLPTNGFARNYSGVSLDSFVKKITVQKISEEGIQLIGPAIEFMAAEESLQAHKNAVTIRLKSLRNEN